MKRRERYAVCHFKHGWVIDLEAGGSYSYDELDAATFDTPGDAEKAMTAAELGKLGVDYEVVPLVEATATRDGR
jgi:hypothetical protein